MNYFCFFRILAVKLKVFAHSSPSDLLFSIVFLRLNFEMISHPKPLMMKKLITLMVSLAVMLGLSTTSFAQQGFEEYGTEEGIRIQYNWGREKLLKADGNAALSLRLTNTHDYPVRVVLDVSFYRDHQELFESRGNVYCLEAGQSLRGAFSNMRFVAEGITLSDIREEWFSWEIAEITVEEVSGCK